MNLHMDKTPTLTKLREWIKNQMLARVTWEDGRSYREVWVEVNQFGMTTRCSIDRRHPLHDNLSDDELIERCAQRLWEPIQMKEAIASYKKAQELLNTIS